MRHRSAEQRRLSRTKIGERERLGARPLLWNMNGYCYTHIHMDAVQMCPCIIFVARPCSSNMELITQSLIAARPSVRVQKTEESMRPQANDASIPVPSNRLEILRVG